MKRVGNWLKGRKDAQKADKQSGAQDPPAQTPPKQPENEIPPDKTAAIEDAAHVETPLPNEAADDADAPQSDLPDIDPDALLEAVMPTGIMQITLLNGVAPDGSAFYAYVAFDEDLREEFFTMLQEKGEIHPFALIVEEGTGYPSLDVQERIEALYDYKTPPQG